MTRTVRTSGVPGKPLLAAGIGFLAGIRVGRGLGGSAGALVLGGVGALAFFALAWALGAKAPGPPPSGGPAEAADETRREA